MPPLRLTRLDDRLTPAVTFRFDFSQDTSGFFAAAEVRAALQRAADDLGSRLQDSLSAITPGGGNSWTAVAFNPVTNQSLRVNNPTVAADEVVVYVVAADLAGRTLGEAVPGSAAARGSATWVSLVNARGQAGALSRTPTDFGPWGGFLAFDTSARWSFAEAGPSAGRTDFETVALHELVHLIGFGASDSFAVDVTTAGFAGSAVTALAGGAVRLNPSGDHWAAGTTVDGQEALMTPAVAAGVRKRLTRLDAAALADIGWQLGAAVSPPPAVAPTSTAAPRFAVGADAGGGPAVALLDGTGRVTDRFFAFDQAFRGGVRVATADFDGDGVPDVLAGTGPGSAEVRLFDGATLAVRTTLRPFDGFTGGVQVAAGDLTGDGVPYVVIAADVGGGPRVRVYDGRDFAPVADFFAIDDAGFRGGARAAVGDVDGDGTGDLIVAAGPGGGPRVAGWALVDGTPRRLFADFFAFAGDLRDGVYVAAGDLTADGAAEVVVGAGAGGGPRVLAFDGAALIDGRQTPRADFFAADPLDRTGVRVATPDLDGDGRADIAVGAGAGGWVAGYRRTAVTRSAAPAAAFEYTAFGGFAGGVFVG